MVGKVYDRTLINRIRDKTENVIGEVQSFRRGRGCTNQIFTVRQICNKYLGKDKDVYFANWMVSNSAKLDSRTKQHTQSGVSTSDGSRDIAATKSWRKKKEKKKITKRIGW